ncbi:MAG: SEC-C domain-containing protein [Planctomycetales bacterium]|nr:SEC-C domain-containing protein [Planctomycetales bacterium]
MALDPYSPCPCGSGKKLKFCCADLATEIEKVQKMVDGEQPHAALRHVERLLEKQPQRESLLDLCIALQLALHEFDAAREQIDLFRRVHPRNPSAHAQAALLAAATATGTEAIGPLQDALELLEDDMPLRVLEAIGGVGQALLIEGELVAARGHLLLYATIAPEQDNRAVELLLRMNLQAGLPLLMREYLLLADCPAAVDWQEQFTKATKESSRGLWRRAEATLAKLREEVGAVPEVVYNLAVMRGWLGQSAAFAAGFHEYAKLDAPLDNAVEAEAIAQLVDPDLVDPTLDTLQLSYLISDIDSLAEKFAGDKRVEDYPLGRDGQDADQATRPRSAHILLDRPTPSSGAELARTEVPNVVAFLSVYGKRTDREARLEVTTDRNAQFDEVKSLLGEIAGDSVGELQEEEVRAQKSISEEALSWRWRLPDDTPMEHRRQLLAEERREAIVNRWTDAPRAALDGKSPRSAVGEASLRIPLLASALIVEQAAADPSELPIFVELRKKLEIPEPEPIDPEGVDLELLPIVRVPRLDLSRVADTALAKLLDRAVLMGASLASQLVSEELVGRPQLDESVDAAPGYRQLIRLEADAQRALDWIEKARAWSQNNGSSTAEWALMELEISIQQGIAERVQRALNEIREKHLNEPGVAEATHRMLSEAGLLAPPTASRPGGQVAPAEESKRIWTPDESSPVEPAGSEGKSAIWTP